MANVTFEYLSLNINFTKSIELDDIFIVIKYMEDLALKIKLFILIIIFI